MRETNASKTKRGTDAKRHFNASDLRELFYVVNEKTKCASADLLSKADTRWCSTHEPSKDASVLKYTMESSPDLVTFLHIVQAESVLSEEKGEEEEKKEEENDIMLLVDDDEDDEWVDDAGT